MDKHYKSKIAAIAVGTAIKVLTAVVCGALVLTGTYGVIKHTVLPNAKVRTKAIANYEGEGKAGGGSISDYFIYSDSEDDFQITMERGATLRTLSPNGLRFSATVQGKNLENINVTAYGFLIMPSDKIDSNLLTYDMLTTKNSNGAKATKAETSGINLSVPKTISGVFANVVPLPNTTGSALESGNLKLAGRALSARAYIKYTTSDNTEKIIYSEMSDSRSAYGTAIRLAASQSWGSQFSEYFNAVDDTKDVNPGITTEQLKEYGMNAINQLSEHGLIFSN